ncbi:hypothetical protein Tco_0029182, partial [Tanacetum coccineum]
LRWCCGGLNGVAAAAWRGGDGDNEVEMVLW